MSVELKKTSVSSNAVNGMSSRIEWDLMVRRLQIEF